MPAMTIASHILDVITDRCQSALANLQRPVVVFDLDATLFNNCPRTIAILLEFAMSEGHTHLHANLAPLASEQLPYRTLDVLELASVPQDIHERAVGFWQTRFFTDDYQRHDMPVAGSVDFVNRLYALGATIVYLSGRDVPGMLVGCTESLRQHGFPIGKERTLLLLKPTFEMGDTDFKMSTLDYISSLGPVVATFDNEPLNCNLFLQKWPHAISVCLDTHCAPGAPPLLEGVVSIPHFSE
jgi:hypothetical protein